MTCVVDVDGVDTTIRIVLLTKVAVPLGFVKSNVYKSGYRGKTLTIMVATL